MAEDIREEAAIRCAPETVRRVMREERLYAKARHKFVVTTQSKHSLPVAENVLARDFTAEGPNRKWASDITYIRTGEGWLYLAGVLDLYSGRVIGWSMSERIDAELACSALAMAVGARRPAAGLIHHGDRGVQYASGAYQTMLDRAGMVGSMSRKGNCWDNAAKESLFGKLKSEWIRERIFTTREEARREIFWYIEVFYNRQRRHATLGYVSPVAFEEGGTTIRAA